jgi:predicted dehydrogenase
MTPVHDNQSAEAETDDRSTIGVGVLGYSFMGRAHTSAYRALSYIASPPSLTPRLVTLSGRDQSRVADLSAKYGYEGWTSDWRDMVADSRIALFDNTGPNGLHAAPTIAAAEAGKHVFCEKPLGRTGAESFEIWQRVAATGVKHMCGFNYRFLPACRLARDIIAAGEIGEIRHFRGCHLQDWGMADDPESWRFRLDEAGSGALGDIGVHIIDMARFLVGDISSAMAVMRTFMPEREVDDAVEATVTFANGAIGTIEATRFALGHRNSLRWEINGAKGSMVFDLERMNELKLFRSGSNRTRGFTTIVVSEREHPFASWWWPPGHVVGWEHTFVHEIHHLLEAIAANGPIDPDGATFEDGYRAAETCDALLRSSESGERETVSYRETSH